MNSNVERVLNTKQIVQRTEEWYNVRKNLLTASDAASALGINPYCSRNMLMKRKLSGDKPSGNTAATMHGNKYEDEARILFGNLYDLDTQEVGLFIHDEHKWLGGSPDGVASDGSLLEIKCPLKREIKHEIPVYYYPQVQICMEILNIEKCYFIQYKPMGITNQGQMDILEVPRSKEWFQNAFPKLLDFWNELQYEKNPCPSKIIDCKEIGRNFKVPDPTESSSDDDELS